LEDFVTDNSYDVEGIQSQAGQDLIQNQAQEQDTRSNYTKLIEQAAPEKAAGQQLVQQRKKEIAGKELVGFDGPDQWKIDPETNAATLVPYSVEDWALHYAFAQRHITDGRNLANQQRANTQAQQEVQLDPETMLPADWDYKTAKEGPWGEPLPEDAIGWLPKGKPDYGPGVGGFLRGAWSRITSVNKDENLLTKEELAASVPEAFRGYNAPQIDTSSIGNLLKSAGSKIAYDFGITAAGIQHLYKSLTLRESGGGTSGIAVGTALDETLTKRPWFIRTASVLLGELLNTGFAVYNQASRGAERALSPLAISGDEWIRTKFRSNPDRFYVAEDFYNWLNENVPIIRTGVQLWFALPAHFRWDPNLQSTLERQEEYKQAQIWRMGWTAAYDEMAKHEYMQRVQDGEDPRLLAMELENPSAEMFGQMAFDPMWAWDLWIGPSIRASRQARKAAKIYTKIAPELAEVADDVAKAISSVGDEAAGVATKSFLDNILVAGNNVRNDAAQLASKRLRIKALTPEGARFVGQRRVGMHLEAIAASLDANPDHVLNYMDAVVKLASDNADEAARLAEQMEGLELLAELGGRLDQGMMFSPAGIETGVFLRDMMTMADGTLMKLDDLLGMMGDAGFDIGAMAKVIERRTGNYFKRIYPTAAERIKQIDNYQRLLDSGTDEAAEAAAKYLQKFPQAAAEVSEFERRVVAANAFAQKFIYRPAGELMGMLYMGLSPSYWIRNWNSGILHIFFDQGVKAGVKAFFKPQAAVAQIEGLLGFVPRMAEQGIGAIGSFKAPGDGILNYFSRKAQNDEVLLSLHIYNNSLQDTFRKGLKVGAVIPDPADYLRSMAPDQQNLIAQIAKQHNASPELVLKAILDGNAEGGYKVAKNLLFLSDKQIKELQQLKIFDELKRIVLETDDLEQALGKLDEVVAGFKREGLGASADNAIHALEGDLPEEVAEQLDVATQVAAGFADNGVDDVGREMEDLISRKALVNQEAISQRFDEAENMISRAQGEIYSNAVTTGVQDGTFRTVEEAKTAVRNFIDQVRGPFRSQIDEITETTVKTARSTTKETWRLSNLSKRKGITTDELDDLWKEAMQILDPEGTLGLSTYGIRAPKHFRNRLWDGYVKAQNALWAGRRERIIGLLDIEAKGWSVLAFGRETAEQGFRHSLRDADDTLRVARLMDRAKIIDGKSIVEFTRTREGITELVENATDAFKVREYHEELIPSPRGQGAYAQVILDENGTLLTDPETGRIWMDISEKLFDKPPDEIQRVLMHETAHTLENILSQQSDEIYRLFPYMLDDEADLIKRYAAWLDNPKGSSPLVGEEKLRVREIIDSARTKEERALRSEMQTLAREGAKADVIKNVDEIRAEVVEEFTDGMPYFDAEKGEFVSSIQAEIAPTLEGRPPRWEPTNIHEMTGQDLVARAESISAEYEELLAARVQTSQIMARKREIQEELDLINAMIENPERHQAVIKEALRRGDWVPQHVIDETGIREWFDRGSVIAETPEALAAAHVEDSFAWEIGGKNPRTEYMQWEQAAEKLRLRKGDHARGVLQLNPRMTGRLTEDEWWIDGFVAFKGQLADATTPAYAKNVDPYPRLADATTPAYAKNVDPSFATVNPDVPYPEFDNTYGDWLEASKRGQELTPITMTGDREIPQVWFKAEDGTFEVINGKYYRTAKKVGGVKFVSEKAGNPVYVLDEAGDMIGVIMPMRFEEEDLWKAGIQVTIPPQPFAPPEYIQAQQNALDAAAREAGAQVSPGRFMTSEEAIANGLFDDVIDEEVFLRLEARSEAAADAARTMRSLDQKAIERLLVAAEETAIGESTFARQLSVYYGELLRGSSSDEAAKIAQLTTEQRAFIQKVIDDPKSREFFKAFDQYGLINTTDEALQMQVVIPDSGTMPATAARHSEQLAPKVQNLLNEVKAGLRTNWGEIRDLTISPAQMAELRPYLDEMGKRRSVMVAEGLSVAQQARDFALHAYPERRGFDTGLGFIYPYHFWYSRTYKKWMERLAYNPAAIAAYAKYRAFLEKKHAGLPDWWKYNLNTNELLGLEMENPLWFNLESTLNPLYALTGVDFEDPKRRADWWGATMEDLNRFGPSVWTPFQLMLALNYHKQGKEDAAARWAGRSFVGTRFIRDATALLGWDEGKGLEVDPFINYFADGLGPYERARVGRMMWSMAGANEHTQAEILDALYAQEGPIWDKAVARVVQERAPGNIASFLLGTGFKPRTQADVEIDRMYAEVNALYLQKTYLSPEQYRNEWDMIEQKYPFMDMVLLAKREEGFDRDEAFAWNVLDRIPPGASDDIAERVGIQYSDIQAFYENKGLEGMDEGDRLRFMGAVIDIAALLDMPPLATRIEWDEARGRYRDMQEAGKKLFGDAIYDDIDLYFAQPSESRSDWLDAHPVVAEALDWQAEQVLRDPLMAAYYSSIDKVEKFLKGRLYDIAEGELGDDLWDHFEVWSRIRDIDSKAARRYWKDHPQLDRYVTEIKPEGIGEIAAKLQFVGSVLPEALPPEYRDSFGPEANPFINNERDAWIESQVLAYIGDVEVPPPPQIPLEAQLAGAVQNLDRELVRRGGTALYNLVMDYVLLDQEMPQAALDLTGDLDLQSLTRP
jgi:hypothetical protein